MMKFFIVSKFGLCLLIYANHFLIFKDKKLLILICLVNKIENTFFNY